MRRQRGLVTWLLSAALLMGVVGVGCDALTGAKAEKADDDDDSPKKKKKKKKKSDEDADDDEGDDEESDADEESNADDDGKEEASKDPPAPPTDFKPKLANGRSPTPTLSEWDAQEREVTVKGSSALNCETKMVREYLRVSCRGRNDTGGTPTTLRVIRGSGVEAHTYASGGITSLVIPFVEGIDAEVLFSWTDKSHPLRLQWPRGAPQPQVIGTFEGAKSPLDGTDDATAMAKLCSCHKKVTGDADCANMMAWHNPDCMRTYGGDCQRLLECSRGEPSAIPACQSGYTNAFTGHTCLKVCGRGKNCPPGFTCTNDISDKPVCVDF